MPRAPGMFVETVDGMRAEMKTRSRRISGCGGAPTVSVNWIGTGASDERRPRSIFAGARARACGGGEVIDCGLILKSQHVVWAGGTLKLFARQKGSSDA